MQSATNGTTTPAQRDFLPVTTHEKAMDHSAGTKSIGSRDRTRCQECPSAVLLIVCAGAILSFGGMGSTLLLVPDYSGAALLSAIIFIVALIPPGPALLQGGGAESALLLSGGALAALCAACRLSPVRPPSLSPLSSWCWPACAASASASASASA